jgi:hypothetical protein
MRPCLAGLPRAFHCQLVQHAKQFWRHFLLQPSPCLQDNNIAPRSVLTHSSPTSARSLLESHPVAVRGRYGLARDPELDISMASKMKLGRGECVRMSPSIQCRSHDYGRCHTVRILRTFHFIICGHISRCRCSLRLTVCLEGCLPTSVD